MVSDSAIIGNLDHLWSSLVLLAKEIEMTPETLAEQWLTLFTTNCGKAITNKNLLSGYMEIDRRCKELSEEDQVRFKSLIHHGIKETMKQKRKETA